MRSASFRKINLSDSPRAKCRSRHFALEWNGHWVQGSPLPPRAQRSESGAGYLTSITPTTVDAPAQATPQSQYHADTPPPTASHRNSDHRPPFHPPSHTPVPPPATP